MPYQRRCVVQTAGPVTFTVQYYIAALCCAGVCLCLFLLLNAVYFAIYTKPGLNVSMTKQMSNSKEIDSELLTLENHVDLTSFGRHDFSRVNNSLCLPPYHLTFV